MRIGSILRYYLVFKMKFFFTLIFLLSKGLAQFDPYNFVNYPFQGDSVAMPIATKAMFKSLIIPGWGQIQNKDPWWMPAIFACIESIGLVSSINYENRAEDIRREFESFGDDHWTIKLWYFNTKRIFPDRWEKIIIGTHKLDFRVNGDYYHSDELTDLVKRYSWEEISVLRDRDFYENIGKYDQFVGGWDDPYDDPFDSDGNWYSVKKGNVESVILTKQKEYYREQRHQSNLLKHYSRYAVTIVMFNHLASGLEAAWTANKKSKNLPDFSLNYNPLNKWGVGGVRITYAW